MIIPQHYPLYAASVYMAGDADVRHRDRDCSHNPDGSNVAVSRIIGWDISDDEKYVPLPISETEGRLVGYRFATYEARAAAQVEADRLAAAVEAFWAGHSECDGECRGARVELGEALAEDAALKAADA